MKTVGITCIKKKSSKSKNNNTSSFDLVTKISRCVTTIIATETKTNHGYLTAVFLIWIIVTVVVVITLPWSWYAESIVASKLCWSACGVIYSNIQQSTKMSHRPVANLNLVTLQRWVTKQGVLSRRRDVSMLSTSPMLNSWSMFVCAWREVDS